MNKSQFLRQINGILYVGFMTVLFLFIMLLFIGVNLLHYIIGFINLAVLYILLIIIQSDLENLENLKEKNSKQNLK